MNKTIIASFSLFVMVSAHAELSTTVTPAEIKPTTNIEVTLPNNNEKMICLIAGTPSNVNYKVIKRVKAGKGTYGSVTDVYPKIKHLANHYKADAIINYNASQRFGFWPWRIVRPVITGVAVKFESPMDCTALNGKLI